MSTSDGDNQNSKVTWQADTTHPDLVEPLKEAFRNVVDPEIGMNIIELGLIRDVKIEDSFALITMILTTPFCPYGPSMLEMTRQKAEITLQRSTRIEMGIEMWDFSMMEDGVGGDWGIY